MRLDHAVAAAGEIGIGRPSGRLRDGLHCAHALEGADVFGDARPEVRRLLFRAVAQRDQRIGDRGQSLGAEEEINVIHRAEAGGGINLLCEVRALEDDGRRWQPRKRLPQLGAQGGVARFLRPPGEGQLGLRFGVREPLPPLLQPIMQQRREAERQRGDGQLILIHVRRAELSQPVREGCVCAQGSQKRLDGGHRRLKCTRADDRPGVPQRRGAPEGDVRQANWRTRRSVEKPTGADFSGR